MHLDRTPRKEFTSKQANAILRMHGLAAVRFAIREGMSRLITLNQRTPLRVLFPKMSPGTPPLAAITTVSGGLVGGDRLDIELSIDDKAAATAIGQAAEKVYRSNGPDSLVSVSLNVGAKSWLEWLPQETILFDSARLNRRTVANVHSSGRLLAGECLVFGRLASGEVMMSGKVRDVWEIRDMDGRLIWADALLIEGDILRVLDSVTGFGGARAFATAVYVGPDAIDHLPLAKELTDIGDDVRSGATCRGNVLIARWLSECPLLLRNGFERYWMEMRGRTGGLTKTLSRLWYV